MEYFLFILVFILFMGLLIIEKESMQRDNRLKKRIKKLNKKIDELAVCTFCLLKESDVYAKIQESEQVRRKE